MHGQTTTTTTQHLSSMLCCGGNKDANRDMKSAQNTPSRQPMMNYPGGGMNKPLGPSHLMGGGPPPLTQAGRLQQQAAAAAAAAAAANSGGPHLNSYDMRDDFKKVS